MSIARIESEWIEETKSKIGQIGQGTGAFYEADGELCSNDDPTVKDHTYAAVTAAWQNGTIKGDRQEIMALVKEMLDMP